MTRIWEELFDTYGDSIMKRLELYEEDEVMEALDQLSIDRATKVEISNLLFSYYFRWSTAAFAIGVHLGLALTGEPFRRPKT